jgi:hypothetical protein
MEYAALASVAKELPIQLASVLLFLKERVLYAKAAWSREECTCPDLDGSATMRMGASWVTRNGTGDVANLADVEESDPE